MKKRTTNKLFALLLTLVMVLGILPMTAFAADPAHPKEGYTSIWSEGFESGIPSTWSKEDVDDDGFNWEWSDDVGTSANNPPCHGEWCVLSESYDNDSHKALSPDNWLYLPSFDLTNGNDYLLTFMIQAQDDDYPGDKVGVFISTNGGTSYTQLGSDYEALADWREIEVNLSSYAGQTVNLAVVHHNSRDKFVVKLDCFNLWGKNGSSGDENPGDSENLGDNEGSDTPIDVNYKVEHYLQQADGTYALEETENLTGTAGQTVTATPDIYEGYTYDAENANEVKSGTLTATAVLTLKLYYNLNESSTPGTDLEEPLFSVSVDIVKEVVKGGNVTPPAQDFEFELFDFGVSDINMELVTIKGNKVSTNGAGNYRTTLTIETNDETMAGDLSEGFYLREKQGTAANWTYSPVVYHVRPDWEVEGAPWRIFAQREETSDNGTYVVDAQTVDAAEFTNTYTNSTSDYDYDDDDEVEDIVPPKQNPDTGDNSNMGLWIALAGISLFSMVAILFGKRRLFSRSR